MNNKKLKSYVLLFVALFLLITGYSNSLIERLSKLKAKGFVNFLLKYFHYKSNLLTAKSGKLIINDNFPVFSNNYSCNNTPSHFHVTRSFFKIFSIIRLVNSKASYFSFFANARIIMSIYNKIAETKVRNFSANYHASSKHIISLIIISVNDVFMGKVRSHFFSYNY